MSIANGTFCNKQYHDFFSQVPRYSFGFICFYENDEAKQQTYDCAY